MLHFRWSHHDVTRYLRYAYSRLQVRSCRMGKWCWRCVRFVALAGLLGAILVPMLIRGDSGRNTFITILAEATLGAIAGGIIGMIKCILRS